MKYFDAKLFALVIAAIAATFLLLILDQDIIYPLVLLAVASNIVTAYVSYHWKDKKPVRSSPSILPVILVFSATLVAIIAAFFVSSAYVFEKACTLLVFLFLTYLLLIYSKFAMRR
jgi:hypothetical protein